ncbi:Bud-site selection protein [Panus rudis PR-1116 ss-1]|nr:Bud-site selection protein [Panus rudis PR-1116 ss-1]
MSENTQVKKGVKRKRPEGDAEDTLATKIQGKLHHEAREVRKAAKKAKTFETQKLVKKLKGLRSKNPDAPEIKDLEAQLTIVKEIDHEPFGNTALKTKLKKDKLLSSNPHIISAISSELESNLVSPAEPKSNLAKVQAHMLSSKVLAAEVTAVVERLRNVINPPPKSVDDEGDGGEGADEGEEGEVEEEKLSRPKKVAKVVSASDDEDESEDGEGSELHPKVVLEEDDEAIDDGGWESGSVHESESAESEGDDSEDDSDSDSRKPKSKPPTNTTKSQTAKPSATAPKPKASSKPTATPTASSTFLPSLSVGFTRGDSDASDIDEAEINAADGGVRKNRRGQRARRAIWEKKYGKNANHVKKQFEEAPQRGGSGGKNQQQRGPQNQYQNRKGGHGGQGRVDSAPSNSQGKCIDLSYPLLHARSSQSDTNNHCHFRSGGVVEKNPKPYEKKADKDKPLHPSWEAKRKLKEKLNPSIDNVVPMGKKIVFS